MTRRTCSLVVGLGISVFDILALGLHYLESNRKRSLYVRARLLQYLLNRLSERSGSAVQRKEMKSLVGKSIFYVRTD